MRLFRPNESKWGIVVSDTGAGIPESELTYIFDTFQQVDSGTTHVHGGFGLGLSIVKQLVNIMNGEIEVQSILGEGATFSLPYPWPFQSKLLQKGADHVSELALIIEDDEDLANIFAGLYAGLDLKWNMLLTESLHRRD